MYNVVGGVWTDTSFKDITYGTEEFYGPFERYEDAEDCWRSRTWRNVDICSHRLFIVQVGIDLAEADREAGR